MTSRFEEEEHEPVAVVRTLCDFALALTLIVLMLIGTHETARSKAAETRAARREGEVERSALALRMIDPESFVVADGGPGALVQSPERLAEGWRRSHSTNRAAVVVQFPEPVLAKDLHRALLNLQSAFGASLERIETLPQQ